MFITYENIVYIIKVVLNRGAAEPLGAAKSSRGAANFWSWLLFTGKLQLGVPPNC